MSPEDIGDEALRAAVTGLLAAADRADPAAMAALYDAGFRCVRVADEGGSAQLTREQMLGFFQRAGGHTLPTRATVIHHAEVVGGTAFVVMTRVKDLGNGWEPLYYNLVWTLQDGGWRLLREFVHQRSVPRWAMQPPK